jgi:hypothetical protein
MAVLTVDYWAAMKVDYSAAWLADTMVEKLVEH